MREQPASLDLSSHQQMNTDGSGMTANLYLNERHRDLAICAVLLDEWLKELSAISQEQSIVMLNENYSI